MKRFISTVVLFLLGLGFAFGLEPAKTANVTIASGAAISGAIDLSERTLLAIEMPAAWTAADVGFSVATTLTGTYKPLWVLGDSARLLIDTAAASRIISVDPDSFRGVRYLKIESLDTGDGSAENQAAARTITIIARRLQ